MGVRRPNRCHHEGFCKTVFEFISQKDSFIAWTALYMRYLLAGVEVCYFHDE